MKMDQKISSPVFYYTLEIIHERKEYDRSDIKTTSCEVA
jgi:hypothetical protein